MKTVPMMAATALLSATWIAHADAAVLWAVDAANSAGGSHGYAEAFSTTGTALARVDLGVVNPTGIAIVGQTAYYTNADNGNIGSFNILTNVVSAMPVATGRAAFGGLTWDGSNLWATDYEGGNEAYQISLAGKIVKTVTLANCGSYCSGIEYIAGVGLVANRGPYDASAAYDVYDTNGTLLRPFISGAANGAGLAYDGSSGLTYVSDYLDNQALVYNQAGALVSTLALGGPVPNTGFGGRFVADLALAPTAVPEPVSAALLGLAAAGLGLVRRRR